MCGVFAAFNHLILVLPGMHCLHQAWAGCTSSDMQDDAQHQVHAAVLWYI